MILIRGIQGKCLSVYVPEPGAELAELFQPFQLFEIDQDRSYKNRTFENESSMNINLQNRTFQNESSMNINLQNRTFQNESSEDRSHKNLTFENESSMNINLQNLTFESYKNKTAVPSNLFSKVIKERPMS
jgi:uncharacterized protein YjbI with pentapeptide repeats